MGRASGRVANQTKGGFLDDTDVEIVGARFEKSEFEGSDGTVRKTQAVIEYEVEGRDEPIPIFYSVGSQDVVVPLDEDDDEVEVGQYFGGADGKELKGVNENSAWGKFQARLVAKCKFPDENFDLAIEEALVGLRGHLVTIPGGKFKGQEGRPIPVFDSIEKDSIPGKKGKKSGKVAGKAAKPKTRTEDEDDTESDESEEEAPKNRKTSSGSQGKAGKPVGKPSKREVEETEDEETEDDGAEDADEGDGDDLEARVGAAIQKAVKKGALPKGRLAQAVGRAFEDDDQRPAAVKLTMSDKFLKAGVEEGLWSYDGREVGVAE